MNIPNWLRSSADPEKVSLTFKGLAVGLIPLVIVIARTFDIEITENELSVVIGQLALVISAVLTLFGLVRKLLTRFQ